MTLPAGGAAPAASSAGPWIMIHSLQLADYRNIASARMELGARFTVLFGPNGAGKTNLLEALYLMASLRSFRVSDLGPLVRGGASAARITLRQHDLATDLPGSLEIRLERVGTRIRRTALADGKLVRRAADFMGRLRAILFTPEDLAVLRGGPGARRKLLDRVVFGQHPAHLADTVAYDKLVRTRNRVLREHTGPAAEDLLSSYEAQLSELGARIWSRRADCVTGLGPYFAENFARVMPGLDAMLTYQARLEQRVGPVAPEHRARALADALRARRREDAARGHTTTGPHRDELLVELEGRPAASFASQGQTRALMLAFKLAELRVCTLERRNAPVLLLDDVSSELDAARTELLFQALAEDAGQCLLTTTDPDLVQLDPSLATARYRVEAGAIAAAGAP